MKSLRRHLVALILCQIAALWLVKCEGAKEGICKNRPVGRLPLSRLGIDCISSEHVPHFPCKMAVDNDFNTFWVPQVHPGTIQVPDQHHSIKFTFRRGPIAIRRIEILQHHGLVAVATKIRLGFSSQKVRPLDWPLPLGQRPGGDWNRLTLPSEVKTRSLTIVVLETDKPGINHLGGFTEIRLFGCRLSKNLMGEMTEANEIGMDDGLGTSALLEESDSSGSAVGLIVGSAIGVGLLALTVIFLCILLIVRKSRQQKMQQMNMVDEDDLVSQCSNRSCQSRISQNRRNSTQTSLRSGSLRGSTGRVAATDARPVDRSSVDDIPL